MDDDTRAALRRAQAKHGDRSVNATIRRLLIADPADAKTLFTRHRRAIREILRRHGLRNLVAFGSRARGDATEDSDLDLAVEADPKAGALSVLSAEADLEEELGVRVELIELPNAKLDSVIRREGVPFGE